MSNSNLHTHMSVHAHEYIHITYTHMCVMGAPKRLPGPGLNVSIVLKCSWKEPGKLSTSLVHRRAWKL